MQLIFNSNVTESGKLESSISNQIKSGLVSFIGKNVTITITDETERTVRQNNLWWVYVGILSKETGNTNEEMHELLKSKFIPFSKSTTTLTSSEFSQAIKEMKIWAVEYLNVILPE